MLAPSPRRPNSKAIHRAHGASRVGELRYTQQLQAVMKGFHKAAMRGIEPYLRDITWMHTDATRWGIGLEDRLHHFIQQIPGHVEPAFDHMAREVNAKNLEVQTDLLGFRPPSGGVPTVIETAKHANIQLMVKAADDYAESLLAVMEDPEAWELSVDELVAVFNARGDASMFRAGLIARDQAYKLNAAISESRQRAAGVESYWWSTCLDERVRKTHRANEGVVFSWAAPSVVTGHPGHDPNCRCLAIPIVTAAP